MKLRFILGDQLNLNISSISDIDAERDVVLMCEVWDEATYVQHHKKKIAFIFSAMRHFAEELVSKGYKVHYTKLDHHDNAGSFSGEVKRSVEEYQPNSIVVTEASEYRVLEDIKAWNFGVPIDIRPDDRFLCAHDEFEEWARSHEFGRRAFSYLRYATQRTLAIILRAEILLQAVQAGKCQSLAPHRHLVAGFLDYHLQLFYP